MNTDQEPFLICVDSALLCGFKFRVLDETTDGIKDEHRQEPFLSVVALWFKFRILD